MCAICAAWIIPSTPEFVTVLAPAWHTMSNLFRRLSCRIYIGHLNSMELFQIRYFLAVCDALNFTRAAEACHVSQPALTRAIKRLEAELGGDLFRRERSRTHMTELGRTMRPFLQQSLDSALAAKVEAKSYGRGEKAKLRLGISSTIDIGLVVPALCELSRALSGLEIHLVRRPAPEIMQMLEDGDIELCLAAMHDKSWDRVDQWELFSEDFLLLVGDTHQLGGKRAIALSELAGEKIITRPFCEQAGVFTKLLRHHDVDVGGYHELSDQADIAAVVSEGLGLAIAPRSMQMPQSVAALPIKGAEMRRTVSLYGVSGRSYSPPASGLIRLLRAASWMELAAAT